MTHVFLDQRVFCFNLLESRLGERGFEDFYFYFVLSFRGVEVQMGGREVGKEWVRAGESVSG